MPNFVPIAPNFYKRSASTTATALQSVQNASSKRNGNNYSARGTANRTTPGFNRNGNNRGQAVTTPNVLLQGAINAAVTSGVSAIVSSTLGATTYAPVYGSRFNPYGLDPAMLRLYNNNLPPGATYGASLDSPYPSDTFQAPNPFTDQTEDRVIIKDQTGLFISGGGIFAPLNKTGGMLFPYTPNISVTHKANYEMESLVHTNYANPYYTHSTVDAINIQGRFTAQTNEEGKYVLAMIHFFRTVTKMFYGGVLNKGAPPPVLYLDAHGQYMFDHIPVVVSSFQYNLPNDTNYITIDVDGKPTKVPADLNITVDLIPTYSRNKISNNFNLLGFSRGALLTSGSGSGSGGWL